MDKSISNAEALFARAVELPAGATRATFLAAQCGGNATLLAELESLLRAHDQAGAFLRSSAEQRETNATPAGKFSPQGTAIVNAIALGIGSALPEKERPSEVDKAARFGREAQAPQASVTEPPPHLPG